ncbi:glycosyltransferase family 4 protein [Thermofilum sp.]|uniref:glycosyltransferase family 4 protein n=1 Tax=Thermofilum sp. TaxID=1961369 RepID=UPI0031656885
MLVEIYADQFNVVGGGGQHRALMVARGLHMLGHKVMLITPHFKVFYEELIRSPQKYYVDIKSRSVGFKRFRYLIDNSLLILAYAHTPNAAIVVMPCPIFRANVLLIKRGSPLILDFGDIWFSEKDISFYRYFSMAYLSYFFKFARRVIMPTSRMTEYARRLFPHVKSRILHIPSSIDTDAIKPSRKSSSPVITYVGTLNPGRGLEILPKIVEKSVKKIEDVLFKIVGSGPLLEWLKRETERRGLSKYVSYLGDISFYDLPSIVGDAWLGLSLYPRATLYPVDVLKALTYMSMGMPLITSTYIEEALGVSLQVPFDPRAFAEAIYNLVVNDSIREQMSYMAREICVKRYDVKLIAKKYEQIITSL